MRAKPRRGTGRNRIAARLGAKLDKTLVAYANAATAAGVGILVLTVPAEAKIVYTHVDKKIPFNKTLFLDLNHDGIADFGFNNTAGTTSVGAWGFLTIFPAKSVNQIWGAVTADGGSFRYASALAAGVQVGPNRQLTPGNKLMAHSSFSGGRRRAPSSSGCKGPWKNVTNRYLGLKFMIEGKAHYGWARLTVACSSFTVTATLTGYAYETIPNKAIITGKTHGPTGIEESGAGLGAPAPNPATLGLLAMGSSGQVVWRRREQ
jgi:hypothetical protein